MSSRDSLTSELLLEAYGAGIFPMSEGRDTDDVFWVDPRKRGILPMDGFHISRSLRKRILSGQFLVTVDQDFEGVVAGCAAREETWINDVITTLYLELFDRGSAHSLEVWSDDELVGGVYGVTLGAAFFGESMFSRRTDASKLALAYLMDRLKQGGFALFDTQFITDHLSSLGGIEIPRADYRKRLEAAVTTSADFNFHREIPTPQDVVQRNTQTS